MSGVSRGSGPAASCPANDHVDLGANAAKVGYYNHEHRGQPIA
jgi:hypothetical protein